MLTTIGRHRNTWLRVCLVLAGTCLLVLCVSALYAEVRPDEVERELSPIYQLLTSTVPKFLCVISLLAGGAFLSFRQVSWGLIAIGSGVFFGLVAVLARTLTGGM